MNALSISINLTEANNYTSIDSQKKLVELADNKLSSNDIMDYCRQYLSKTQCPHDIQIVEKINHV